MAWLHDTINTPAFVRIFIDNIVRLHEVPQEVVSDHYVRSTADYWREVGSIQQMKMFMSTQLHPERGDFCENSNKTVVYYLCRFPTHGQANWDDYLPFAQYAYNSSVLSSTTQTPFEFDFRYELPLPLDCIEDLQRPQANASANTFQGSEFVEQLQHIMGGTMNELRDAQDEQMPEANTSQSPIDPAINCGAKVFLDTQDLPITNANVNPIRCKLVNHDIGPYKILRICRNAVKLDLPNDMTIYDTVNVSRLKVDCTDDSRVIGWPLPPPVRTRCMGTSYVVQSITNHHLSSEGTGWKYTVNWEGWDENDNTWKPDEHMAKAKEMVKQYWKEIGRRTKTKRRMRRKE
jgi:hypothetical protein